MRTNFASLLCKGLFFCLAGCASWHVADSVSSDRQMTVRIPYIQGDDSGELTSRVIEAVSLQPGFCVDESGQYLLRIHLLDDKEEKIGFRYNPRELKKGSAISTTITRKTPSTMM